MDLPGWHDIYKSALNISVWAINVLGLFHPAESNVNSVLVWPLQHSADARLASPFWGLGWGPLGQWNSLVTNLLYCPEDIQWFISHLTAEISHLQGELLFSWLSCPRADRHRRAHSAVFPRGWHPPCWNVGSTAPFLGRHSLFYHSQSSKTCIFTLL